MLKLALPEEKIVQSPAVKSYGSLLFPLVFLLQLLFSGEVYHRYKSITESLHKEAKSERWYRKYLSELEMQGLILAFESGKGIRGHTKLIKLMYPPQKTKDVLEKDIFGADAVKDVAEK